ncbi:ion transporter [Caulobacter sp. SLTY]|uniref:ion transporter n=1 Tax=Caulobacter sp. SLTY TaxID=2683262 RepID=UPI001412C0BC|nr:ion transporter [Caulobacter sp. SLTY]NBB16868.1 ion transporter [Caulobacter sp. SLTY]
MAEAKAESLRARIYRALDPEARKRGLSITNIALAVLIVVASLVAITATEPTIYAPYARAFITAEWVFGGIFLVEYLARLWVAAERPGAGGPWKARLGFMFSFSGIVDLISVIATLTPGTPAGPLLRAFRLMRVLRLAKLGRLSSAWRHMAEAVSSRRSELILSLGVGVGLMVLSATLLYLVEGDAQPDKFGSIPRALWWAVATLTTIGYGDIFPITPVGKLLASVTAITSIGLIALPTGILAAAFSDAMARHREAAPSEDEKA